MTAQTVSFLKTNLLATGQAAGAITPTRMQDIPDSFAPWDDAANSSGLSAPALLRGTVKGHLASGVTVGSGNSTATQQATQTGLQNAINYAASNGKFFELIPNTYEIYPPSGSTPLNIPASTGFVWRGSQEGTVIKQFYPTAPGTPVLTIGDSAGSSLMRAFSIEGAYLQYGTTITSSFTSANGLQLFNAAWGTLGNITVGSPYRSVVLGNTTGTGGFAFSCRFHDFILFNTIQDFIYQNIPGATGNHWDNVYMTNGTVGTYNAIAGNFINMASDGNDQLWSRINCEWTSCNHLINMGNGENHCLFDTLHFEGIKLTGFDPAYFWTAGNSLNVQTMAIMTPVIQSAAFTGTATIFGDWLGGTSTIAVRNLWLKSLTGAGNPGAGDINTNFNILWFNPNAGPQLDDFVTSFTIDGLYVRDLAGTIVGNMHFDTKTPVASFRTPTKCERYDYGPAYSKVEAPYITVSSTYTHYGQYENATIAVPASITSFTLTLANTMGATGTQPVRTGNTVRVRRMSGTASGTLTVSFGGTGTPSTNTTSAADLWYQFDGTHWQTFTPVTS